MRRRWDDVAGYNRGGCVFALGVMLIGLCVVAALFITAWMVSR